MKTIYPEAQWLGQSPNVSGRFGPGQPSLLMIHCTAGGSGLVTAQQMMRSGHAGAPFCVDRDGKVYQISEADRINWHAGESAWKGRTGLNKYAVGIEFANYGFMKKGPGGAWMLAHDYKLQYKGTNGVIEARHKNGGPLLGWEKYTDVQVEAGLKLAKWLLVRFPTIVEVVAHSDVAPKRRADPGPAFPMDKFEALFAKEK